MVRCSTDIAYPTPIDPADNGESVEDNALPWDSIDKANYSVLQRNDEKIVVLTAQHQARIATYMEFQFSRARY
ncbi:carboxy terminal-processing peptidase [Vibrio lentus]|nr:carboxy terminal-processing peptidase [Vibrio lentus]